MIQLTFDPDFTGVQVPRVAGMPTPYWVLTREQWYLVVRIIYREHIRAHVKWHFSETDPNSVERKAIADHVGALVQRMRDDRLQIFSRVEWGTRIAWWTIACFAFWYASQRDQGWVLLQNMDSGDPSWVRAYWDWLNAYGCPNDVLTDYSYGSGLAVHGASLDPIQPFADPANEATYEQECDGIWWNLFSQHSLTSGQSVTLGGAEEAGSGYAKAKPALAPNEPGSEPAKLLPGWFVVTGAVGLAGAVITAASVGASAVAKLFRRGG